VVTAAVPTTRAPRADAIDRLVVWGALVVHVLAVLAVIAHYGRNVPIAEDWLLVPPLTGNEPDVLQWLWAPNAEHRVPLPKLLYLLTLKLAGGDFRSGMLLNTALMTAMTAACVVAARRIRGRLRWQDVFFPLAILHLGNLPNLAWGWQIQYVSAAVLSVAPLLVIVVHGARPTTRAAAFAAVSVALLPLTGANGLVFAVALGPWYLATAVLQARDRAAPGARIRAALLGGGLAVGAVASLVYLLQYERPSFLPPNPGLEKTVITSLKFAAMSAGAGALRHRLVAALLLTPVVVGACLLLVRTARRALAARDPELWRAGGLACFFFGCLVVIALMGWGRAAWVPLYGMPPRYTLLGVPLLLAAYYAWELYATRLRRAAQALLVATLAVLMPGNIEAGLFFSEWHATEIDKALADVRAGVPREELARRHLVVLLHWDEPSLRERIGMLRDAGIGPFARVPRDAGSP
jgi:hypothetical protein